MVKDRLKKAPWVFRAGSSSGLCIARALAVQPDVLLMDEPTRRWTRAALAH